MPERQIQGTPYPQYSSYSTWATSSAAQYPVRLGVNTSGLNYANLVAAADAAHRAAEAALVPSPEITLTISDLPSAKARYEGKLVRYQNSNGIERVGICVGILPIWEHNDRERYTYDQTDLIIRIRRLRDDQDYYCANWIKECTIEVFGEETP